MENNGEEWAVDKKIGKDQNETNFKLDKRGTQPAHYSLHKSYSQWSQHSGNSWEYWMGKHAKYEPIEAQESDRIRGRFVLYDGEKLNHTL